MRKLNKKGETETMMGVFRSLIVFVILFFVGYKFGLGLIDWLTSFPDEGTQKILPAIEAEINALDDIRQYPVYIDENHIVKVFTSDSDRPEDCENALKNSKSLGCICICGKDKGSTPCDEETGGIVNMCKPIQYDFTDNFLIEPKINNDKQVTGQMCQIQKIEDKGRDKIEFSLCV